MNGTSDGSFSVAYPGMQTAIDEFYQATKGIENALEDLMRNMQPLIATWSGAAQGTWQSVQQGWNSNVGDMNQQLANAQQALGAISDHYQQMDNQLAQQWSDTYTATGSH